MCGDSQYLSSFPCQQSPEKLCFAGQHSPLKHELCTCHGTNNVITVSSAARPGGTGVFIYPVIIVGVVILMAAHPPMCVVSEQ